MVCLAFFHQKKRNFTKIRVFRQDIPNILLKESYFLLIEFLWKTRFFLGKDFMKRIKKLCLCTAIALSTGIVGCNLFNPAESVNIESDDTNALTYEGYIHFRNAEYTLAREYFERTLAVDSTISEAWYGLAKSVLNQQKLNVFEMLKYANSKDGTSGFMNMDDSTANHYKAAIDSVMKVLDVFIERDTTGKTDGKVTFKTISTSYTVMHLTKAALILRDSKQDITKMFNVSTNPPSIDVDWKSLKDMGETTVELFNSLGDIGTAVAADPAIATEVIRSYVPEAALLSDSGLTVATETMAAYMITASETVDKSTDGITSYMTIADMIDNDGDGCIDEEIADGYDNDGDGLIDEDMRDNMLMVFETDFLKYKIGQVQAVSSNEAYDKIDIDMNGTPADENERNFVIKNSNERVAQGDHRFTAFTGEFTWVVSMELTLKEYMDLAKNDTDKNNIQYNLAWRKEHIGGCWNNYTEETFLNWFEGRGE